VSNSTGIGLKPAYGMGSTTQSGGETKIYGLGGECISLKSNYAERGNSGDKKEGWPLGRGGCGGGRKKDDISFDK